jgi:hypothetical protein
MSKPEIRTLGTMEGWQFCRDDMRLGLNDGLHIRVGRTLKVEGEPVLCDHGLHASKRIIDALTYAGGNIICRVELGGKIVCGSSLAAATERTVLWMLDAETLLHEFACRCAERALETANITDEQCWHAIETKRKWLNGDVSDDELDAARDAAKREGQHVAWNAAQRWEGAEGACRTQEVGMTTTTVTREEIKILWQRAKRTGRWEDWRNVQLAMQRYRWQEDMVRRMLRPWVNN